LRLQVVIFAHCVSSLSVVAFMMKIFRIFILLLICCLPVSLAQAQSKDEMEDLRRRADQLQQSARYGEALPLVEQLSEVVRTNFGDKSGEYAAITARRAGVLQGLGRYPEAEDFFKQALELATTVLGPEHAGVTFVLNDLALLYKVQGRFRDAEPIYRRALAIREKALGPNHAAVAHLNSNLGALYFAEGRYSQAEPLFVSAITVFEKTLKPDHPEVGKNLNNLATLYWALGRFTEAEPLYKRALFIIESSLGSEHPNVSAAINNLALVYQDQGRFADAEPLFLRALGIREKALGMEHPDVAESANNLAWFYQGRGRYTDAEPLYQRALKISEKALGSRHSTVGSMLNNLAVLYYEQGQYAEAEPLFKRAVAVRQGALGAEHSDVGQTMYRLARLYDAQKRFAEAWRLHERALQIRRKAQGPEHPEVIQSLDGIARMYEAQRNWKRAVAAARQARDIVISRARKGALAGNAAALESGRREIAQGREVFSRLVRTLWEMAREQPTRRAELLRESYLGALWSEQTEASAALAQMSVRQAKGQGSLAELVRERQDLVRQWQALDKQLYTSIALSGGRNLEAERQLREQLAGIDSRRGAIDETLKRDFAEYFALANPEPVSTQASKDLLKPDEALVQFMVSDREVFVWAISRSAERWARSSLDAKAVSERVAALRCGLDSSQWEGDHSANACEAALKTVPRLSVEAISGNEENVLPFDLSRAHELYTALLAPVDDVIKGKQLLVVASGSLTSLPFHVLVSKRTPKVIASRLADYPKVAWLGASHSITMLPSVVSLKSLRQYAKTSRADKPYLGFGNPLLSGPDGDDRRAWERQACRTTPVNLQVASRRLRASIPKLSRSGLANVEKVRAQYPLPETTDELCAVAQSLRAGEGTLYLGDRASEKMVKALSANGTLATARVVHFATHGLLAGETESLSASKAEPALILTPPETGSEDDDGLLTASEIAQLKLDADWVVLSACNTAAGENDTPGAEALSGLARAFFYAGARALLVSHWAVNSEATVKLITKAFDELRANPKIGRAEALRRSMLALSHAGGSFAHPANWAPFVVVGEGSR
jgi:CHAT domain-containing protein/tetratricopeptide (TPR) repeat protein